MCSVWTHQMMRFRELLGGNFCLLKVNTSRSCHKSRSFALKTTVRDPQRERWTSRSRVWTLKVFWLNVLQHGSCHSVLRSGVGGQRCSLSWRFRRGFRSVSSSLCFCNKPCKQKNMILCECVYANLKIIPTKMFADIDINKSTVAFSLVSRLRSRSLSFHVTEKRTQLKLSYQG